MKILLISGLYPSEENPVFGVFVKRQVEALRSLGNDVTVVANTDTTTGVSAVLGKYKTLYARALKAAKAQKWDVVVGHFLYPTAWIARKAAKAARVPYVVVAHGSDVGSVQRSRDPVAFFSRRATAKANGVVTVSQSLNEKLLEAHIVGEQRPVLVSHMGVDESVFYPRKEARMELGFNSHEKIALQVGNLVAAKGPELALEACESLFTSGTLDKLIYVGDGDFRPFFEAAVKTSGLAEKVLFVGRCTSDVVANYMSAANIVLLPSRAEGLGLVILEALACGTPVAASLVGGIPEILPKAPCGWGIEPGDVEALKEIIEKVVYEEKTEVQQCASIVSKQSTIAKATEFCSFLNDIIT